MKPTFLQRLDVIVRSMTPFLLTLAFVVLAQVPLHIPGFAQVAPILPLMAVYHWTIYRPDLLPSVAAFFAGLLHDALSGMPFGVSASVFVIVHMVVMSQQVFFQGKSFPVIWLGFSLVASGAMVLTWLLNALFFAVISSVEAAFVQYLVTVGSFPVLAWLLTRWQRSILAQV